LEGGGYFVTGEEKEHVKMFVEEKKRNIAFVLEAVKYHIPVREMRKTVKWTQPGMLGLTSCHQNWLTISISAVFS
jgi:hypothetical protein